jgi:altronate hydrolase
MPTLLTLHPEDNVSIALEALTASAHTEALRVLDNIPAGHKVATRPIPQGEAIRRYGQIIGFASEPIAPGQHVHTHNVQVQRFERRHEFGVAAQGTQFVEQPATFEGFVREDGRVGTRNYLAVLTSVNCSATVARYIANAFSDEAVRAEFPNVDGVVAFTHGTGCGQNIDGEGLTLLRRVIAGYAVHPNVGGALLLGLGCEVNQVSALLETQGLQASPRLRVGTIQSHGGTRKTVAYGTAQVREMLQEANRLQRTTAAAAHLTLGLECGGSDAYSGISANPALGAAADLLVRHGGSSVLSETPEIYGAEHLLTRRAVSPEVGEKLLERIRWWEAYTARHGGEMNNNPTPGNKAGGLTTILEKSLGAVAKGGTSDMVAVYEYAQRIQSRGFAFMDTPGYDPVSITGQVAGGCNLVCFTTGRGSVYGCKPAPSLKLATNSAMYQRMEEDMDFNCGEIIDGTSSVQAMGEKIFQRLLELASGSPSKSEALGFGDYEFVPWQIGAVM